MVHALGRVTSLVNGKSWLYHPKILNIFHSLCNIGQFFESYSDYLVPDLCYTIFISNFTLLALPERAGWFKNLNVVLCGDSDTGVQCGRSANICDAFVCVRLISIFLMHSYRCSLKRGFENSQKSCQIWPV